MLSLVLDNAARVAPFAPHSSARPPVAPRLGRAFARAANFDLESLADLRRATFAFVARLKGDGLPPERVVLALKAALLKYGGVGARPSLVGDDARRAQAPPPALYSVVFVWCIAAYFGTGSRTHSVRTMHLNAAFLAVALALGCRYRPEPVPVAGDRATLRSLAGTWVGEYTGIESGRSGEITFIIRATGDSAFGDVLMVSRQGGASLRPLDPPSAHAAHVRSTQALRIDFVSVTAGAVSGTIEPYIAPDCDCEVATTFSGRITGDVVDGTFVTRGPGISCSAGGGAYNGADAWLAR